MRDLHNPKENSDDEPLYDTVPIEEESIYVEHPLKVLSLQDKVKPAIANVTFSSFVF